MHNSLASYYIREILGRVMNSRLLRRIIPLIVLIMLVFILLRLIVGGESSNKRWCRKCFLKR